MKEQYSFDFMLWQLVHRTFRSVDRLRERELEKQGLTSTKAAALRVIAGLGEEGTVTEISKHLFLEVNTVSEQLKRMEQDGLVKRVKCPGGRNAVRVEVTAKGYRLYRKTETQEAIDTIMSVLTRREKTELWEILSKMGRKAATELALQSVPEYLPLDYSGIEAADQEREGKETAAAAPQFHI